MFGTLADAGINIEMISTSEIRITTIIAEDRVEEAVRALHAAFELEQPETVEAAGAAARLTPRDRCRAAPSAMFSRVERFATASAARTTSSATGSPTASPEVCVAVADEQTAGRGRHGRTWTAPARRRAAAARSGFRPDLARAGPRLAPRRDRRARDGRRRRGRRGPARSGAVRLKWPNDLVIETGGPKALLVGDLTPEAAAARLAAPLELRKLAGVLGESEGLGTDDPRVVVGIGINADWAAADFPPELAADDDEPARGLRRPADRPRGAARRRSSTGSRSRIEALRAGVLRRRRLGRAPGDDRPAA